MRCFGEIPSGLWLSMVVAALVVAPHSRPARASSTTVLVPAYVYPSGAGLAVWDQLAEGARSITVEAILNPGSGPGTIQDPHYVAVVAKLREAGGRVLGYVHTSYGQRPLAAVEQDIRTYIKFYRVDGFFVDEMANTSQAVEYYETIYRSIKQLNPEFKVVGNPGTPYTLRAYLGAVDTLVIFEGSAAAYADYQPFAPAPWVADYPPSRFANIVYDVGNVSGIAEALNKARQTNAGSVFITDDKLPNPYRGLPSYWIQEVAAIEAIDGPLPAATAFTSEPSLPGPTIVAVGSTLPGAAMVLIPQRPCEPRVLQRLFRSIHPARGRAAVLGFAGLAGR
jgi:hypothetical protein